MEIDLRDIQTLHARYAREPVIIDLEAQVRARPTPLLLAHDPAVRPSPLRRAWKARASIGRGALMVAGGTALSAVIGMGAAQLWAKIHRDHAAHAPVAASHVMPAQPASRSGIQADDPQDREADVSGHALTSQDLGAPARGGAMSSVDPSALMRPAPAEQQRDAPAAALTDEQKAIASPLRQHILERAAQNASVAVAPMHIPPPATEPVQAPTAAVTATKPAEPVAPAAPPAPTPTVHAAAPAQIRHAIHRRPTAPQQAAATTDAKPAPAAPTTAPHGDVQLF